MLLLRYYTLLLIICIARVQTFHITSPQHSKSYSHSCRVLQLRVQTSDEDNEEQYSDITQNLFPENRRVNKQAASSFPSAFKDGELKDMNDRLPPQQQQSPTTTSPTKRKVIVDNRASALYQRIQSQRKQVASKKTKSSTTPKKEDHYDITQSSFPEERRDKSSFRKPQLSEMNAKNPRWNKQQNDDEGYLDIMSQFPKERPSLSVNTGTLKERTTSGTYYDEKRKIGSADVCDDDSLDDMNFPSERPSTLVNTGTESVTEGIKEVSNDSIGDDESFDITKQHFVGDRQSFRDIVNGSGSRRGTTAGQSTSKSYEGAYRDIAHNFSSNVASLRGHPKPRKVQKNDALNQDVANRFSSDIASLRGHPEPRKITKVERATKAKEITDSEYMDKPRVFKKDLDLTPPSRKVPSTIAKGVVNESVPKEADKFLDNSSFAWNLDSTKKKKEVAPSQTGTQENQDQPFLDKPRVFQSNIIDMKTNNMSGAQFKRSSVMPPEQRVVRDHYDTEMASNVSTRRRKRRSDREDSESFDITRAPLSDGPLSRTSSAVRDANTKTLKERQQETMSQFATTYSSADLGDLSNEEKELSYDEVMYWLLSHLPNLQEEDAITYFHHLVDDGFDSIDLLTEQLVEDDLMFMKKAHRRALLKSISENVEKEKSDEEDEKGSDDSTEDEINGPISELTNEERVPSKTKASDQDEEEFDDITRSTFVNKSRGRPSLSSVTTQSTSSRTARRGSMPVEEDEAFDITRDSFTDRPSYASASNDANHETLSARDINKRGKKAVKSRRPISRDSHKVIQEEVEEDTPSLSSEPLQSDSNKGSVAPRAELYQYYIEKGLDNEEAQRLKDYFTTWSNDAKSHEIRFTSIFTCPITGEHFACGNLKQGGGEVVVEDKTYWYSKLWSA